MNTGVKSAEVAGELARSFEETCTALAEWSPHKEYVALQRTWNREVLEHFGRYVGRCTGGAALSLGAFHGALELAVVRFFEEIVAVDHECFLPPWTPATVHFHRTNLDTSEWLLPERHYSCCFMIEVLEHLLWSPVPLLRWLARHCDHLFITTPDDDEWPAMTQPHARHQHYSALPTAFPGAPSNPTPMTHCKQYRPSEFVELVTECGFRVVELQRVGEGGHQVLLICTSRGDGHR